MLGSDKNLKLSPNQYLVLILISLLETQEDGRLRINCEQRGTNVLKL